MAMLWPLAVEGKGLDVAAHLAELTGFVRGAAREGLPAHELERGWWRSLLRLGHDLQAAYFVLAGEGGCGETLTLADGEAVKRLPELHSRPYRSIFGGFRLERIVYGTREGQRIEAAPLAARLGLPAGQGSHVLRDWNQALVVEAPFVQVNAMLERLLGLNQPVPVDRPRPHRPVPQQKRVCAVLPVAAAVAEALAPPRPAEVAFPWLVAEARQRDPEHQHPWVLLMAGWPAPWEAAATTLGDTPRIEIRDLLHATSYLGEAVHLFLPSGSSLAVKLMQLLVSALLDGRGTGGTLWLQDLAEQGDLPAAARSRLAQIHGYFEHHRNRIHYDRYRAAGSPIASGAIEGACRHVVKDRMERASMHWTLPGARALLNLRCIALNDEWEPFMSHYIRREASWLHANCPVKPQSTRLRLVA